MRIRHREPAATHGWPERALLIGAAARAACIPRWRPGKSRDMKALPFASRLIAPAAMLVFLGGCSIDSLSRTFGLTHDAPDEFTVVTRAPLSMPPDYTLRPPEPGAFRPQETSDRMQAESALVPEAALGGTRGGMSPGQAALVRQTGGASPNIRQQVDHEASLGGDDSIIDKVLFWRKPDDLHATVDARQEAQRLRQNSALGQSPDTGDTPIIRDKKPGWWQDLFSWL
jgi:hypothetical protein